MARTLLFSFCLALLLPAPLLLADDPVAYVRADGQGWPCGTAPANACRSLATAIQYHGSLGVNTIRVATGTYEEKLILGTTTIPASGTGALTIEGGWDAEFSVHNPDPAATVLLSSQGNPLLDIEATDTQLNLALSDLTLKAEHLPQFKALASISAQSQGHVSLALHHCLLIATENGGYSSVIQAVNQPGTLGMTLHLDRCRISGSDLSALHLLTYSGPIEATVQNSIIADNTVSNGSIGAVASFGGTISLSLINDTIHSNTSLGGPGGIYLSSSGPSQLEADIINTIAWDNETDLYPSRDSTATLSVAARNSLFGAIVDTEGLLVDQGANLHSDPLLTANHHLSAASPAIDAGICGYWYSTPFPYYTRYAPYDDIDGQSRPGTLKTFGCDIGADEFFPFPWELFLPALLQGQ